MYTCFITFLSDPSLFFSFFYSFYLDWDPGRVILLHRQFGRDGEKRSAPGVKSAQLLEQVV